MPHSSLGLFALLLLSLFSTVSVSQHTTSPRFTPQPTSSGVVCIQMLCPSLDSSQPTCPSDCPSGCKLIPDQCCPQLTVAVCQESRSDTSTASPSTSTALGASATTTRSSTSSSTVFSSSPSPNSNFGIVLQPSLSCLFGLSILLLCLFGY